MRPSATHSAPEGLVHVLIDNLPLYLSGLLRTLQICAYAGVLALVLGTVIAG